MKVLKLPCLKTVLELTEILSYFQRLNFFFFFSESKTKLTVNKSQGKAHLVGFI